nr:MAG TPA: hypothetical protein [Caudoviricetes sp.]
MKIYAELYCNDIEVKIKSFTITKLNSRRPCCTFL